MTTVPAGLEFRPVHIPAHIDADDAADLRALVEVRNAIYREINGNDDESMDAERMRASLADQSDELMLRWLVLEDGIVVGRLAMDVPLEEGSRIAFWLVELREHAWGRGIGSTGLAFLERQARAHGRSVLQSGAAHPDRPGERVDSPTGFGSIPLDHAARFFLRHGYRLQQVERFSALPLDDATFARAARLLADAEAASDGYRVVRWLIPTAPENIDGYAWMKSRMVTDTPSGELEYDEEVWDSARIARHEEPYLSAGMTMQVTALRHEPSGELVAFNELVIGADRTAASHQEDTLVLREHRGHRLGLRVKCAGLLSWRELAPDSPRIYTYNAEENRPMLDINETIGFVPVSYSGLWKKVLDD